MSIDLDKIQRINIKSFPFWRVFLFKIMTKRYWGKNRSVINKKTLLTKVLF